ncbi:MAG: HAD-IA family hydrolase [Acidobacteriota bacterium]|nr:HAD-IA family hydrolase [Acidobacteriota bacterium]
MIKTYRSIPAKNIQLLLWDLDGTLVNSALDLALAVNVMLRGLGREELSVEVITGYVGNGAQTLVRRALGNPEDESFVNRSLQIFLEHYNQHQLDNTQTYPGIQPVLEKLYARGGLKMAVLTNKPQQPSQAICDGLGLSPFFTRVLGGDALPTRKPDPQGAHLLMQEFGARPEETLMIGDSHNDVLTARNADMYSIGVTYGLSPASLQTHPPDVLVDRAEELLTVLEL